MPSSEQVLVVPRQALDEAGSFQGFATDSERYLGAFFQPGVPRYMTRSVAETDPGYKQLIPYVIITCNGRVLSYVRGVRAGESRLIGNRSIGIGGHIDPPDGDTPLFPDSFRDAYLSAVEREVNEELSIDTPHRDQVIGLLNDDSNDVGKVHVGIVHHWALDTPSVSKREQMITQLSFMTPGELHDVRDSLESWSGFCLDLLPDLVDENRAEVRDSCK